MKVCHLTDRLAAQSLHLPLMSKSKTVKRWACYTVVLWFFGPLSFTDSNKKSSTVIHASGARLWTTADKVHGGCNGIRLGISWSSVPVI